MSCEYYTSASRGRQKIADMAHHHLSNAYDKLVREADPEREPERQAMARQIAANNEAFAEAEDAKAQMEAAL